MANLLMLGGVPSTTPGKLAQKTDAPGLPVSQQLNSTALLDGNIKSADGERCTFEVSQGEIHISITVV